MVFLRSVELAQAELPGPSAQCGAHLRFVAVEKQTMVVHVKMNAIHTNPAAIPLRRPRTSAVDQP
jgi:hypothetical protein